MSVIITRPYHNVANIDEIEATKQAKVALLEAIGNTTSDVVLTKAEIDLVVEDCYSDIVNRKTDGNYIAAVIEGVGMYVASHGNKQEDVKEGAEQLLALASRTIKGEGCGECEETYACSGSGVSPSIHEFFVEQILDMIDESKQPLSLGSRGDFTLDKLCAVHNIYRPLRHHKKETVNATNDDIRSELESMWCHLPGDSHQEEFGERTRVCWDLSGTSPYQQHWKGCRFYDL